MPPNSNMDSSIRQSLPRAATIWVNRAKGKAKTSKIREGFVIGGVVSEGEGRYSLTITNESHAAEAYEYGSGLHRTKGSPEKYLIKPRKSGGMLAIPRERWPKYEPPPDVDPVRLKSVQHPGVKPEPFMKPAFEEVKSQMGQIIGRSFAVEVVHKSIREMWRSG